MRMNTQREDWKSSSQTRRVGRHFFDGYLSRGVQFSHARADKRPDFETKEIINSGCGPSAWRDGNPRWAGACT